MKIETFHGILQCADFIPSPNCDDRPLHCDINLLVIHNISLPPGEFGGTYINQLFCNQIDPNEHPFFQNIQDLRVSSHLLIQRSGNIIQYVPFHKRAWHAGVSNFQGKSNCNDFSIGIELEGTDHEDYEEIQYRKLALITQQLLLDYPNITRERITGHCHISPNRKTDPGKSFDWKKYHQLIAKT